jgi:hypothetical protein
MKNLYIYLLLLLCSCHGAAYEEYLVDNYSLKAMDVKSGMSVFYNDNEYLIGIIQPTVFAVGHNNDFIIAKQHPNNFPIIDKSITNYFIIPIKKRVAESVEKNVIGPLTIEEFNAMKTELRVPESLVFTKVFEDLE